MRIQVRASSQTKGLDEAENRQRNWGETLRIGFFSLASHALQAFEASALRARKTLTPRFTDFFTDFEKKSDYFAVYRGKGGRENEKGIGKRGALHSLFDTFALFSLAPSPPLFAPATQARLKRLSCRLRET